MFCKKKIKLDKLWVKPLNELYFETEEVLFINHKADKNEVNLLMALLIFAQLIQIPIPSIKAWASSIMGTPFFFSNTQESYASL